jgi:hypothetical protein
VVQQVLAGAFEAGAANSNVVAKAIADGAELRIIHVMHSVSFPWVAKAGLPRQVLAAVTASLMSLKDPAILGQIDADLTGLVGASPEDYNEFEKLMEKSSRFEAR